MSAGLNGVSCPSKRVCLAVGTNAIQDGFIYRVLAERCSANGVDQVVGASRARGAAGNFPGQHGERRSCACTVCEAADLRSVG